MQNNRNGSPVTNIHWSIQATKTITFGEDGVGEIPTSATATVTADTVTDGDTVTIDGRTYTFQTVLVDTADNILIGVSDATALDNLKTAINAGAGEGTLYGTGTAVHDTVNATTNTNTTQVVEANDAGTEGNSIEVSATGGLSWDEETLTGGTSGQTALFHATGPVMVFVLGYCLEEVTDAGGTATLEIVVPLGIEGPASLLEETTASDIKTGFVWNGEGPTATASVSDDSGLIVFDTDINQLSGTEEITAGTIQYVAYWYPLSPDAKLEAVA